MIGKQVPILEVKAAERRKQTILHMSLRHAVHIDSARNDNDWVVGIWSLPCEEGATQLLIESNLVDIALIGQLPGALIQASRDFKC